MLGRKGKARPQKHNFDFTGLIKCGTCGCMITAEEKTKHQKNGNIHHYTYYHCSKRKEVVCDEKCLRDTELVGQIAAIAESVALPREFHTWAMKWFKEESAGEIVDQAKLNTRHQNEYDACIAKIDALIDMRAAKEIDEEDFARRRSALNKDKVRLQSLLAQNGDNGQSLVNKADKRLLFAVEAKAKLMGNVAEDRRGVLVGLGSNPSLKSQILNLDIEKPLLRLQDVSREVKQIHDRLEPPANVMNTNEIEQLYAQSSSLR